MLVWEIGLSWIRCGDGTPNVEQKRTVSLRSLILDQTAGSFQGQKSLRATSYIEGSVWKYHQQKMKLPTNCGMKACDNMQHEIDVFVVCVLSI